MSIVQLNIRTRIELETRVLAAALKQSFERGDSDGVSLAHRQLFLLLKDQKAGNGASQAESAKSKNGDAASHREEAVESQEQPAFAPAAFAEPELPDFDEQSETTADVEDFSGRHEQYDNVAESGYEEQAEFSEAEHAPGYEEVAEVEQHGYIDEGTQSQFEHAAEVEPGFDYASGQQESGETKREKSAFEILEEAYEAELARQRAAEEDASEVIAHDAHAEPTDNQEIYDEHEQTYDEHAPVIDATVVSEEPLEIPTDIYEEQSSDVYPPQDHVATHQPVSETGDHPVANAAESPYREAEPTEQAQAIQQYLRYKKTREQLLAQEVADRFAAHKAAEAESDLHARDQSQYAADEEIRSHLRAEAEAEANARMEAEVQQDTSANAGFSEEEDYVSMRKKEPPKKVELPFDAPSDEYAKVFGAAPADSESSPKSDRRSQSDTGEFQTAPGEDQSNVDSADARMGQAYSHSERIQGHDEPFAPAAQAESPTEPENFYPKQQALNDYEARKADQSRPRNMPAIDFSLSSEAPAAETPAAAKPDIDFSLSSETPAKPDIDFSLSSEASPKQAKPKLPDIDFSLESEAPAKGPNIDFSLESETKAQSQERDFLSAPAGGGFIEAEFVSKEIEAGADEYANQDVTSELPVLNPNASLYEQVDDTHTHEQPQSHSPSPSQVPSASQAPTAPLAADPPAPPALPPRPAVDPAVFAGLPRLAAPTPKPVEQPQPEPLTAAHAQETTSQEEPVPPAVPRPPDLYALLGVSQMSPFEEIHKNFLRKIRRILRKLRGTVRPERDELLKDLRRHWVARDILCDPVTRTDYDFRDMGLRGSPEGGVPQIPDDGPQRMGQRTPLRIGELLQCAGLLEMAELEIACDMHKAMPEVQFGTFLVRQGFIQERDLESVLLGQSLLREGKITVAQFQVAMELSQSRGANISDTLIEHGYINAAELQKLTNKQAVPEPVVEADIPKIKEIEVKPKVVEPPPANLNASSAVPTWKDQLDWSKPLPVDDDASLVDRDPQKQSLANLLGGKPEGAPAPDAEVVKISNNAAPSWKDQLDWDKPEEHGSPQTQPETNEQPEGQAGLSATNAVPSWKDQLDWEEPKTAQHTASDTTNEYQNDTASGGAYHTESDELEDHLDEHSDEHADDDSDHEHGADDATTTSGSPDQPHEEKEGFFKKNFGKFRKGDPKDKKKKRK